MKNIIITGASSGIGAALALILAENHNVLLLARNLAELKKLQAQNPRLRVEALDLTRENLGPHLHSIITAHFSQVDILINNAGKLVNKPVLEITRQDMEQVFATNVFGLIETCQVTIPLMKAGAHIVNIGSMGGFQGSVKFPGLSVYSSSKSAVAGFSECLAEELKEQKIAVNCLALGSAQTEMLGEAFPGYKAPVSAAEMAEFITDFSLNANRWINGKTIPVSLSTP
ncbi:MAG: SDR family oxidoreductase [Bacteroidetes bacterium]|nr:SDR family oxidoreductase [Bacteroidota bacterium]